MCVCNEMKYLCMEVHLPLYYYYFSQWLSLYLRIYVAWHSLTLALFFDVVRKNVTKFQDPNHATLTYDMYS